jgi:hypothetical protein
VPFFFGNGHKLGHLISHRAHSLRPLGKAYGPVGATQRKLKKLRELGELCEITKKWVKLTIFPGGEIRTNLFFPHSETLDGGCYLWYCVIRLGGDPGGGKPRPYENGGNPSDGGRV